MSRNLWARFLRAVIKTDIFDLINRWPFVLANRLVNHLRLSNIPVFP